MVDAQTLKALLRTHGVPLAGVGDLHEIEAPYRDGFPLAVVLAAPLDRTLLQRVYEADYPLNELADEYKRVNGILANGFEIALAFLRAGGFRAVRMDDPFVAFDPATQAARLTHKMCATRAGLGWIGKSGLLVTPDYGPAVRLTTLLTDAPLQPDPPVNGSPCGACDACRKGCPAGAIKGNLWQLGVGRNDLVDAVACQAYKQKIRGETGWDNPRCGKCIAVCTRTRRYVRG